MAKDTRTERMLFGLMFVPRSMKKAQANRAQRIQNLFQQPTALNCLNGTTATWYQR